MHVMVAAKHDAPAYFGPDSAVKRCILTVGGQPIMDGERIVGHVTAGAWSPYLESGIGYARFDQPGAWAGRSLTVNTADGHAVACEIVDLPFYDAEKLIPRGLSTDIP